MTDYLTTGQLADLIHVHPTTIARWRVEGCGPRFSKTGRGRACRVLYRRSEVEEWLDSQTFSSTTEADSRLAEVGR